MFRVFLVALMIWALCVFGSNCGSAKLQSPQQVEKKPASPALPEIRLTNENPTGALVMDNDAIPANADILEISITKVVNPNLTPISVSVYLNELGPKSNRKEEKTEVGNFSIYPPDRVGKFLLPAPLSLSKLPPKGLFQISFELKRVDESKPWTTVEVELSPPTWRADEKKK